MTHVDYFIVAAFLITLATAGIAVAKLIHEADDIFVAGRELTPFILCATITATNISIYHFVGFGGTAYAHGVSVIWLNWTGSIALVLSGLFVLPVLRRLRIRSIPEMLEIRYSTPLRVLVGALWSIRLSVYLGIILYVGGTAAVGVTQWNHYNLWLLVFSIVAVTYSSIGGAWAVAIMDSVQFLVMLLGALITLPIAVHFAGGMPAIIHWLNSTGRQTHTQFIIPTFEQYDWLFVYSAFLLSIKWGTIDQSILQRAFGSRDPRSGARGMVLAAIITAPFAFFWILPGLAASKLYPGQFSNPDDAIPHLLTDVLPRVGRGLLGIVLCGLVAAQISVITADINSVATLMTSDVYRKLRKTEPGQRELLRVVRMASLFSGVLMFGVAILLDKFGKGGAVKANLIMVSILDLPLFVVTIIYGIFWRRANWQGATAGFVVGSVAGASTYGFVSPYFFSKCVVPFFSKLSPGALAHLTHWHDILMAHRLDVRTSSAATVAGFLTALIVTPIVSVLTRRNDVKKVNAIWETFKPNAGDGVEDSFRVFPETGIGRFAVALVLGGFVCFLGSVAWGARNGMYATTVAIVSMLVVFAGGMIRVYAD
jgi:SSS family solute:Na+ symporter